MKSRTWSYEVKKDLLSLVPVGICFLSWAAGGYIGFWIHEGRGVEIGFITGLIVGAVLGTIFVRDNGGGGEIQDKEDEYPHRDDLRLYLDGKMKRYSLLFAVNGGAFALAKHLWDGKLPGHLTMRSLCIGMIIFTWIMTADIWLWGMSMRKQHGTKLFRPIGQIILLMIGGLISSGWALIAPWVLLDCAWSIIVRK